MCGPGASARRPRAGTSARRAPARQLKRPGPVSRSAFRLLANVFLFEFVAATNTPRFRSLLRESSGGRDGARRHPRCVERGSVPRPVLGGARGVQTLGAGVQVHRPVSIWSRHHPAAPRFHACSGATRVQPACAHARQRSGADPARGAPQIATSGANSCAPLSRCRPALARLAFASFCARARRCMPACVPGGGSGCDELTLPPRCYGHAPPRPRPAPQGTTICCLCYPIAWRNARDMWHTESFDGAVVQTDMELPLYIFMG